MRLFYLVLLVIGVVSGCQPADKDPVSSRLLIDESTVRLQLSPADAPVETPLKLKVSGEDIVEITGEISGLSMYMGRVPLKFSQHESAWQAEFLLGACSDPKMLWQVELELTLTDGKKRLLKQQFHSSWR
jgi:hypothetical protein